MFIGKTAHQGIKYFIMISSMVTKERLEEVLD